MTPSEVAQQEEEELLDYQQSQYQTAMDRYRALPVEDFPATPVNYGGVRINVPEGWSIKERVTSAITTMSPEYAMSFVILGPKFEGYMAIPLVGPLVNLLTGKAWTYAYRLSNHCSLEDLDKGNVNRVPYPIDFWLLGFVHGWSFFGDAIEPPDHWWDGDEVEKQ